MSDEKLGRVHEILATGVQGEEGEILASFHVG